MPDRDEFFKATHKAKAAVEAIEGALDGGTLNEAPVEEFVASLWRAAGGVPCLPEIIETLGPGAVPQQSFDFVRDEGSALDRIENAVRKVGQSALDLLAGRTAARQILLGQWDSENFLTNLVLDAIQAFGIEAQGGVLGRTPGDQTGEAGRPSRRWSAEALLDRTAEWRATVQPVAQRIARQLVERPEARRLVVNREPVSLWATDLLG